MPERDEIKLRGFIRRMANMQSDTLHTESTLHLILLMVYTALGEHELCATHLQWSGDFLSRITSDAKRAYHLTYLFGCTGEEEYARQARRIIDTWQLEKATAKQKEVADDLQAFIELRKDIC